MPEIHESAKRKFEDCLVWDSILGSRLAGAQ